MASRLSTTVVHALIAVNRSSQVKRSLHPGAVESCGTTTSSPVQEPLQSSAASAATTGTSATAREGATGSLPVIAN